MPKSFVGESFTVALISGTEKNWRRGGVSRFSVELFLSHSAENLRREYFTVALFRVAKKYGEEVGRGVSRFCVEKLLTHSAETFNRESFTVPLFQVPKNLEKR